MVPDGAKIHGENEGMGRRGRRMGLPLNLLVDMRNKAYRRMCSMVVLPLFVVQGADSDRTGVKNESPLKRRVEARRMRYLEWVWYWCLSFFSCFPGFVNWYGEMGTMVDCCSIFCCVAKMDPGVLVGAARISALRSKWGGFCLEKGTVEGDVFDSVAGFMLPIERRA